VDSKITDRGKGLFYFTSGLTGVMAPLRGTNLTTADVTFISWWLSIPAWARVFAIFASFAALVWSARGVFGETVQLPERMDAIEDTIRIIRIDQMNDRNRTEAAQMYMMCLMSNEQSKACDYLVRNYPEYRQATELKASDDQ
jgi:hypothetical protein